MDSELLGDVHTIRLAGELDIATAKRVERELERIAAGDAGKIVVDLSSLTFLHSCGLRAMPMAHARLRDQPHRLAIRRGRPAIQRVFEISGLRDLLPWTD
jgi:anti-sigma B factor antagonist